MTLEETAWLMPLCQCPGKTPLGDGSYATTGISAFCPLHADRYEYRDGVGFVPPRTV